MIAELELNHENVLNTTGTKKVGDNHYIYSELAEYGSIYDLVQESEKLDEKCARAFFRQLLNGLQYLHSKHLVHRDIKMENLLLTKDCTLKICDFGEAYIPGMEDKENPGTEMYRPPDKNTTRAIFDSFSAGIVVFMMCTGEFPFLGCEDETYKEF